MGVLRRINAPILLLILLVLAVCFSVPVQAAPPPTEEETRAMLKNDPELLAAMEIFMGMDTSEREGVMKGLLEQVSSDNPSRKAELEALFRLLPAMEREQAANKGTIQSSNLKQLIEEDEIAAAQAEARRQLDGTDWPSFWGNQKEILEQVLANGQLTPEDAARFQTDEEAWKAQLKIIWEDLQPKSDKSEL